MYSLIIISSHIAKLRCVLDISSLTRCLCCLINHHCALRCLHSRTSHHSSSISSTQFASRFKPLPHSGLPSVNQRSPNRTKPIWKSIPKRKHRQAVPLTVYPPNFNFEIHPLPSARHPNMSAQGSAESQLIDYKNSLKVSAIGIEFLLNFILYIYT